VDVHINDIVAQKAVQSCILFIVIIAAAAAAAAAAFHAMQRNRDGRPKRERDCEGV
jgi:hypothetical protein